jgi:hypothetical protein
VESVPRGLWCYRVDRVRSLLGGALNEGGNLFAWLTQTLRLEGRRDSMRPGCATVCRRGFYAFSPAAWPGWRATAQRQAVAGNGLAPLRRAGGVFRPPPVVPAPASRTSGRPGGQRAATALSRLAAHPGQCAQRLVVSRAQEATRGAALALLPQRLPGMQRSGTPGRNDQLDLSACHCRRSSARRSFALIAGEGRGKEE